MTQRRGSSSGPPGGANQAGGANQPSGVFGGPAALARQRQPRQHCRGGWPPSRRLHQLRLESHHRVEGCRGHVCGGTLLSGGSGGGSLATQAGARASTPQRLSSPLERNRRE
eukprot:11013705-Alexandrium_andersonii.AAC.1